MTPFIQHVQNVADAPGRWPDEFLAWYKPDLWETENRAAAVFIGEKFAALLAELERLRAQVSPAIPFERIVDGATPGEGSLTASLRDVARDALAALDTAQRAEAPGFSSGVSAQAPGLAARRAEPGAPAAIWHSPALGDFVTADPREPGFVRYVPAPSLTVGDEEDAPDLTDVRMELEAAGRDDLSIWVAAEVHSLRDAEHALRTVLESAGPSATVADVLDRLRAQPAAQAEPAAEVVNDYNADGKSARISEYLPAGTKLYTAAPPNPPAQAEPVATVVGGKWDGAEEWMPLAWELCANECGEDACSELILEGGPIPEPWDDRWLKYEDQAKEMIATVRKHVPITVPEAMKVVTAALISDPDYAWSWHCNITMAQVDEGNDHAIAEHGAQRFLGLLTGQPLTPAHPLRPKPAAQGVGALEALAEKLERMHANADVWISTVAAAGMVRAAIAQAPAAEPLTDARDAARYRAIRDDKAGEYAICEWIDGEDGEGYYRDARAPAIVDAAIDAALAQAQKEQQ